MDQPADNFITRIEYPPNTTLEQRFNIESEKVAKNKQAYAVILSFWEAWSILGAIQLACRHHSFNGPSRDLAEAVARRIEQSITPFPAMKEVARRGWDPQFEEGK